MSLMKLDKHGKSVLMMGNDARFNACRSSLVHHKPVYGRIDRPESFPKLAPFRILTDNSDRDGHASQSSDIGRNIRSAAEACTLVFDFDHRNRRFRTDTGNGPPDKTVQDEISQDQNPLAGKPSYSLNQYFGIIQSAVDCHRSTLR